MLTLSGIKEAVLKRLEIRGEATIEVLSFVNVRVVALLRPGDRVFVTQDSYEEIGERTEGIVCEVVDANVFPTRINLDHIDEKEVQRGRIKLRFLSYGRVRSVSLEKEVKDLTIIRFEPGLVL